MKEFRLGTKERYTFAENMMKDDSKKYESIRLLPQFPIVNAIMNGEINPQDICK